MSLHRFCPSEYLTRQSFDVGALTSPPLALSQHLSRSRAIPQPLPPVRVQLSGNKKKLLSQTPLEAPYLTIQHPLSGSESDLTAFTTGLPNLLFKLSNQALTLVNTFLRNSIILFTSANKPPLMCRSLASIPTVSAIVHGSPVCSADFSPVFDSSLSAKM